MVFQAVGQKLDAALQSPVAVAERPEHGGGVSARGHGIRACAQGVSDQDDLIGDESASAICGDEALEFLEPVLDNDKSRRLGGFRASHHQELLPVVVTRNR